MKRDLEKAPQVLPQTSASASLSDTTLPIPEELVLAERVVQRSVTTTISLDSSSPTTQKAFEEYLKSSAIPHTFDRSSAPPKLSLKVEGESIARELIAKLYGLGALDDGFELHRNLMRQGLAKEYEAHSVASPSVEGSFCSSGSFSVSRVKLENRYPFESGRVEPAVRYSVTSKGSTFDVIVPTAHSDHTALLGSLNELTDETSPSALRELKAIRIDMGQGRKFSYRDEATGQTVHTRQGASAYTELGVMNFFEQRDGELSRGTYFHELAHLLADEFFRFHRGRGHPEARGMTSDPSDPWTVWDHAVRSDRHNVPDHGGDNPRVEDFANSVAAWLEDRQGFAERYPARAELLSVFSDNIVDKSHTRYCDKRPPSGI